MKTICVSEHLQHSLQCFPYVGLGNSPAHHESPMTCHWPRNRFVSLSRKADVNIMVKWVPSGSLVGEVCFCVVRSKNKLQAGFAEQGSRWDSMTCRRPCSWCPGLWAAAPPAERPDAWVLGGDGVPGLAESWEHAQPKAQPPGPHLPVRSPSVVDTDPASEWEGAGEPDSPDAFTRRGGLSRRVSSLPGSLCAWVRVHEHVRLPMTFPFKVTDKAHSLPITLLSSLPC